MPLTPKNRKEEWLQGLVDHETTLTPKNRPEAWMKEIIDASGGGGTGGGVTIIHASGSPLTLDKTYAEIYSAFQNGIVMMPMEHMGMNALGLCTVVGESEGVFYVGVTNIVGNNLTRYSAATQSDYPVYVEE